MSNKILSKKQAKQKNLEKESWEKLPQRRFSISNKNRLLVKDPEDKDD